ncbi:MAG TPA: NADH:flavin oxidoreductase/NADH oxidase [Thermomicrobiales bacterium]|jgi:2,4-dienoyl-CoA reductase-like NADH-dependent reductase (Old Yellow Enzyme family)|nr:NADH:flavin oxidoreductase/NADH oxidase [Thermomicrobiales bacterium]
MTVVTPAAKSDPAETAPHLFRPIQLRELTVRNRVWMAPMCMYSAASKGPDTGTPNDWHMVHLGARAVGGVGMVITEATAVSPEGRISPQDLGIWNDRQRDAFRPITRFIRDQGAVAAIQLAHAGRKASTYTSWIGKGGVPEEDGGWEPIAPSADAFPGLKQPREMAVADIKRVVSDFADAARRALDAGFQSVEIHGAHGYLLHEFLSPISNDRTDQYGGSFENRIRLAIEVTDAVRAVWPAELPVLFRVSATDWVQEDGDDRPSWTIDQSVRLAAELARHGVDLIDVSTGGNIANASIPVGPGYQVPFAARIREEAGVPTGAVGLITEPAQAEEILSSGSSDVVLLARELLRDPSFVRRAARELGFDWADGPVQYGRA